jgi:cytochrome c oxidase assembly protein subunit 15
VGGRRLALLGVATVVVIYLQLIVGATMRHEDAGLAIPDLPLAYGKVLPPLSADALAAINHHRVFELNLDSVTLGQVWIHFGHRVGAVIVSGFVLLLGIGVLRQQRRNGLRSTAIVLLALLAAQLTLGVLTVLLRKPADVASAHVAVGALTLACGFFLTIQLLRLDRPGWSFPGRARTTNNSLSHDRPASLVTT